MSLRVNEYLLESDDINGPTIVLIRKDKKLGSRFRISSRITFGREHPANIRIKSSSVEVQHAEITINRSGHVS